MKIIKDKIIKNIKNNYKFFLITISIISIFCFLLFREHYTIDTYAALDIGLKKYGKTAILTLGRLIQYFYFILISFIKNYKTLCLIKTIITIIVSSFNIYYLYNLLKKYFKNNKTNNIIIYLISFIIVINPYTIGLFYYVESPILLLSMLFTILATKYIIENKRIRSFIMLLLAINSYQPMITVFISLSFFCILLGKDNIKEKTLSILWCILLFACSVIINVLFIYFVIPMLNLTLYKYNSELIPSISSIFKTFKFYIYSFYNSSKYKLNLNLYLCLFILYSILFIFISFKRNRKNKKINILYTCLITLLVILISFTPILIVDYSNTTMYVEYRYCIGTFTVFPLLFAYIYSNIKDSKIIKYAIYPLFGIVYLLFEIYTFGTMANMEELNRTEKDECIFIANLINEYQKSNSIEVKNLIVGYDFDTDIKKYSTYVIGSHVFYNHQLTKNALNYFGNLNITQSSKDGYKIYKMFGVNDFLILDKNSIFFDKDTVYIFIY